MRHDMMRRGINVAIVIAVIVMTYYVLGIFYEHV